MDEILDDLDAIQRIIEIMKDTTLDKNDGLQQGQYIVIKRTNHPQEEPGWVVTTPWLDASY